MMKRINSITRRGALKIALLVGIIIGAIEWLRTGYIDGLCFMWTAPLIMLLDDLDPQEWARRKLAETEKEEGR